MSSFQQTTTISNVIDLECGGGVKIDECYSDAEQEEASGSSSSYSQFYSTCYEEEEEEEEDGDGNNDYDEGKVVILNLVNKDCRICHLSLVDDAIELGCCCKNDLAAAHKHCAQTWFKIKGNKICEICNSIASNLVVPNEMPSVHGTTDVNSVATSVARTHLSSGGQGGGRGEGGCINSHRLLNFILACLVFAFVISWLFHFNIPS